LTVPSPSLKHLPVRLSTRNFRTLAGEREPCNVRRGSHSIESRLLSLSLCLPFTFLITSSKLSPPFHSTTLPCYCTEVYNLQLVELGAYISPTHSTRGFYLWKRGSCFLVGGKGRASKWLVYLSLSASPRFESNLTSKGKRKEREYRRRREGGEKKHVLFPTFLVLFTSFNYFFTLSRSSRSRSTTTTTTYRWT
jgi:hypothetical protein